MVAALRKNRSFLLVPASANDGTALSIESNTTFMD
jgi:hypothetical protein